MGLLERCRRVQVQKFHRARPGKRPETGHALQQLPGGRAALARQPPGAYGPTNPQVQSQVQEREMLFPVLPARDDRAVQLLVSAPVREERYRPELLRDRPRPPAAGVQIRLRYMLVGVSGRVQQEDLRDLHLPLVQPELRRLVLQPEGVLHEHAPAGHFAVPEDNMGGPDEQDRGHVGLFRWPETFVVY